jgi:acyl carrier protein
MTTQTVLEYLVELLNTQYMVEKEKVVPEADLDHLGLDSLDEIEIVMALEETFKVDILDEDLHRNTAITIAELVGIVSKRQ